jgi:uncharacterized protein YbbK (DUF523 family)
MGAMGNESQPPLLVSACLAGLCTSWRGESDLIPWVRSAVARGEAIPVCPEQLGGLPTPRVPSERRGERVVSETGRDVTEAFREGAERAVEIAQSMGCEIAVLASRSPSCGVGEICDGTFSGQLVPGDGVAAERLRQAGLRVHSCEDVPDLGALERIDD